MKRTKREHPIMPDINARGELLLSSQFYVFSDNAQLLKISPQNALVLLSFLEEHKQQLETALNDYVECSNCHRLLHVSDDCRCWSSLDGNEQPSGIKDVTWREE